MLTSPLFSFIKTDTRPWLLWLNWLSIISGIERSLVWWLIRVASLIPRWVWGRQSISVSLCLSLSLSLFLPPSSLLFFFLSLSLSVFLSFFFFYLFVSTVIFNLDSREVALYVCNQDTCEGGWISIQDFLRLFRSVSMHSHLRFIVIVCVM